MNPNIIMFILMGVVIFFFVIRPQMKQKKAMQAMLSSLKKGDKVITNSGMHATVQKISEDGTVKVQIAKDVVISLTKEAIVKKM